MDMEEEDGIEIGSDAMEMPFGDLEVEMSKPNINSEPAPRAVERRSNTDLLALLSGGVAAPQTLKANPADTTTSEDTAFDDFLSPPSSDVLPLTASTSKTVRSYKPPKVLQPMNEKAASANKPFKKIAASLQPRRQRHGSSGLNLQFPYESGWSLHACVY